VVRIFLSQLCEVFEADTSAEELNDALGIVLEALAIQEGEEHALDIPILNVNLLLEVLLE
jgi:hypothetical protein